MGSDQSGGILFPFMGTACFQSLVWVSIPYHLTIAVAIILIPVVKFGFVCMKFYILWINQDLNLATYCT